MQLLILVKYILLQKTVALYLLTNMLKLFSLFQQLYDTVLRIQCKEVIAICIECFLEMADHHPFCRAVIRVKVQLQFEKTP